MIRTLLALILVAGLVLTGSPVWAKGSGKGSKATSTTSKPVHVKAYTKKDGTTVEAHDRKAPDPRAANAPDSRTTTAVGSAPATTTTHSKAPIHILVDPLTGRKTITDAPIVSTTPPLHATTKAATTTALMPAAPRTSTTPTTVATAPVRRAFSPPAHPTSPVSRSANGKIQRSEAAKHAFERQTGYPKGRPGYVIDHIKPLACGGADAPSNMQWQTVAAGKAKDKVERRGC